MIKDLRLNIIIELLDGNKLLYQKQQQPFIIEGYEEAFSDCDICVDDRTKLALDRIQRIIDEDFI